MIDLDRIHKGMDVLTSDGQRLGTVRELLGHMLFLDDAVDHSARADAAVPLCWVVGHDEAVRLAKSKDQVLQERQAGPSRGL
jgi:hypothetical protein